MIIFTYHCEISSLSAIHLLRRLFSLPNCDILPLSVHSNVLYFPISKTFTLYPISLTPSSLWHHSLPYGIISLPTSNILSHRSIPPPSSTPRLLYLPYLSRLPIIPPHDVAPNPASGPIRRAPLATPRPRPAALLSYRPPGPNSDPITC